MFGPDIAAIRADDLDRIMIAAIASKDHPQVLDLGCGAGGQSTRLAEVGAAVAAIDIVDYGKDFADIDLEIGSINFVQADINNLQAVIGERPFSDCCLQRTLHYLPYDYALSLLTYLKSIVTDRLYIAVTGLGTVIGEGYPAHEVPVKDRFVALDPKTAETFSMHEPVCLYAEVEFKALLTQAGWEVEKYWVSDFGNIKAVCN